MNVTERKKTRGQQNSTSKIRMSHDYAHAVQCQHEHESS